MRSDIRMRGYRLRSQRALAANQSTHKRSTGQSVTRLGPVGSSTRLRMHNACLLNYQRALGPPHGRALILDRVVRSWLSEHAGLRLGGSRDEREYAVWLRVAALWAAELNISVEQVERLIFTDGLDERSAWRPATPDPPDRVARRASITATRPAGSRAILLGCVKSKLGHRAHAKDLYVSPLWQGRRRYAEASGQPWQILSAKHGLLDPEQTIAPYDVALAHLDADARGRRGERVIQALTERYGSLTAMTFEVHAGTPTGARSRRNSASAERRCRDPSPD
jgi:hypothetical protein